MMLGNRAREARRKAEEARVREVDEARAYLAAMNLTPGALKAQARNQFATVDLDSPIWDIDTISTGLGSLAGAIVVLARQVNSLQRQIDDMEGTL